MQLTLRGCSCLSCTNQADFLPQNSQNSQNLLAVIFSHRFHRCSQMVRLRRVLPQKLQNPQKFMMQDILPQIAQMLTD